VGAQPGVDATTELGVRQQFGDQTARHDGTLVHVEGHALQPGLARQVGGGLAGADALAQQGGHLFALGRLHRQFGGRLRPVQRGVQGQSQPPQHQPGRFVEGVGRAVAERDAGLGQLAGSVVDQLDEAGGLRAHADSPAWRFSSTRR
jgi:hypothetical protein